MTVADYIAKFLVAQGVRHVFGFQGSAMLKMLDAIMETGKIEYIQNFHEQASAFAADGYARLSGGIGVAIATSGPGAVNCIGGVADAFFDSIPVLFLTGQEKSGLISLRNGARQNGFQDMDIVSVVKPIAKYARTVFRAEDIADILMEALTVMRSGRPGPALVDVPIDIQFTELPANYAMPKAASTVSAPAISESVMLTALDLVERSQRPVFLVGGGVRAAGAVREIEELHRRTGIPVVATLSGIDVCTDSVGFSGLYGTTVANLVLRKSDLVVALGTSLSLHQIGRDPAHYIPGARLIHVDVDANELNKTFLHEDLSVHGDVKGFLKGLIALLNGRPMPKSFGEWSKTVECWRSELRDTICTTPDRLDPVCVIRRLMDAAPGDVVVCADVGANQIWTAQSISQRVKGRLLNSAGYGSMGFSMPAAIGCSYTTTAPVLAITGDGGLQMNIQELNTLALRRRNVKCVVIDNDVLALMHETQTRYYHSHYYGNTRKEFVCPDLKKLASVYGFKYLRVENDDDLLKLSKVFNDPDPWLVDVKVDANPPLNWYDDKELKRHAA